jgi:leader peptidase (prepilin peptidase) / N-methyltransferase
MFTTTTAQPTRTVSRPGAAGTVAVAAVSLVVAVVIVIRLAPMSFPVVTALVPLGVAAWVDAVERRLPNGLVLLSAVPVSIVCLLDPFVGQITALAGVAMGGVLLAGPLLALHVIAPASMGFGDVKAATALGATLGLIRPELGLWTLCLASAISAGWAVARRERDVALGPGLVLAATAVVLVSACAGIQVTSWR